MAVTSGFFNSINGDRKYDSLQMAELFDGLIADGVYETIYNQFQVSPNYEYVSSEDDEDAANENAFTLRVDTGRGWFKHTWIKNDGIKLLKLDDPEVLYDRIDAVVIEVDHTDPGRRDDIKIVKGTPSTSPSKPSLTQNDEIYQVPLAYVTVQHAVTSIGEADIENMVGTSACPFVTGVVSVMNIDMLISQWQAQWRRNVKDQEKEWDNWYKTHTSQYEYDFNYWFSQLQVLLEGDVVANLTNEFLKLKEQLYTLISQRQLVGSIDDSDDDPILDSNGMALEGIVSFETCGCE